MSEMFARPVDTLPSDVRAKIQAASFAGKRTKKLASLIETAPPLRRQQIGDLLELLASHPILSEPDDE